MQAVETHAAINRYNGGLMLPSGLIISFKSAYSHAPRCCLLQYIFVWLINKVCMASMHFVTDADNFHKPCWFKVFQWCTDSIFDALLDLHLGKLALGEQIWGCFHGLWECWSYCIFDVLSLLCLGQWSGGNVIAFKLGSLLQEQENVMST